MWRCILIVLVLSLGAMPAVHAQTDNGIPENEDAELLFEEGVAAFEAGNYTEAYDRFRATVEYPLHRKTTAALLMGGRALFRAGRYADAVSILETLLDRYPDTSYRSDATRLINLSEDAQREGHAAPDTLRIGMMLSLEDDDAPLSQAFFNGVRLAVDTHNGVERRYVVPSAFRDRDFSVHETADLLGSDRADSEGATTLTTERDTMVIDSLEVVTEQTGPAPDRVAKMYVRHLATEDDPSERSITAAVDSLVRHDRVDVIIGPFYSDQAEIAGAAADDSDVVLIAPMATEESVSAGREYVFQANPSIEMRGRVMARYAAEGLMVRSSGIVYEQGNTLSRRMADGFREEARSIGIDVPYTVEVESPRLWSRLSNVMESDTTITDEMRAATQAMYIPFSGRNARGRIQEALTGMERTQMGVRVLGNSEWHNLNIAREASRFSTTYTNDFYVDTEREDVQAFIQHYEILTGEAPDADSPTAKRLAYTGHDVAGYVLNTDADALRLRPHVLRNAGRYDGLGIRIDFSNGNINQGMFIHRYRNNQLELVR